MKPEFRARSNLEYHLVLPLNQNKHASKTKIKKKNMLVDRQWLLEAGNFSLLWIFHVVHFENKDELLWPKYPTETITIFKCLHLLWGHLSKPDSFIPGHNLKALAFVSVLYTSLYNYCCSDLLLVIIRAGTLGGGGGT